MKYLDRTFSLVCIGAQEQVPTNEIRVRVRNSPNASAASVSDPLQVHVEKQVAPPAPAAAIASNKLYVDKDVMKDNLFDLDLGSRSADGLTGKNSHLSEKNMCITIIKKS
jgi:hypothetical protein